MSNDLVAIANSEHLLTKHKKVSLKAFCQENFIIREEGSGTRYAIERFLQSKNITPNVRMTIASNEAIIHSVLSGMGVSILSAHTLAFGDSYNVKVIDVESLPIQSKWSFCWAKSKQLSPIAKVFLDYVANEGEDLMTKVLKL